MKFKLFGFVGLVLVRHLLNLRLSVAIDPSWRRVVFRLWNRSTIYYWGYNGPFCVCGYIEKYDATVYWRKFTVKMGFSTRQWTGVKMIENLICPNVVDYFYFNDQLLNNSRMLMMMMMHKMIHKCNPNKIETFLLKAGKNLIRIIRRRQRLCYVGIIKFWRNIEQN